MKSLNRIAVYRDFFVCEERIVNPGNGIILLRNIICFLVYGGEFRAT